MVLRESNLFTDLLIWLKKEENDQKVQLMKSGGRKIGINYTTIVKSR